jgi:hypothetical protein
MYGGWYKPIIIFFYQGNHTIKFFQDKVCIRVSSLWYLPLIEMLHSMAYPKMCRVKEITKSNNVKKDNIYHFNKVVLEIEKQHHISNQVTMA